MSTTKPTYSKKYGRYETDRQEGLLHTTTYNGWLGDPSSQQTNTTTEKHSCNAMTTTTTTTTPAENTRDPTQQRVRLPHLEHGREGPVLHGVSGGVRRVCRRPSRRSLQGPTHAARQKPAVEHRETSERGNEIFGVGLVNLDLGAFIS